MSVFSRTEMLNVNGPLGVAVGGRGVDVAGRRVGVLVGGTDVGVLVAGTLVGVLVGGIDVGVLVAASGSSVGVLVAGSGVSVAASDAVVLVGGRGVGVTLSILSLRTHPSSVLDPMVVCTSVQSPSAETAMKRIRSPSPSVPMRVPSGSTCNVASTAMTMPSPMTGVINKGVSVGVEAGSESDPQAVVTIARIAMYAHNINIRPKRLSDEQTTFIRFSIQIADQQRHKSDVRDIIYWTYLSAIHFPIGKRCTQGGIAYMSVYGLHSYL
jgi:hypothetical protein